MLASCNNLVDDGLLHFHDSERVYGHMNTVEPRPAHRRVAVLAPDLDLSVGESWSGTA